MNKKFTYYSGAFLLTVLAMYSGKKIYDFTAAPSIIRTCDFIYPEKRDVSGLKILYSTLSDTGVEIQQKGGLINDASCLNKTGVYAIVQIKSEEDIKKAIQFAKINNLKITPSGERHSMGGQSFSENGLVLDMRMFNSVEVNQENLTMVVQSGASWKVVQDILDPIGLAVKAMQSINLFTVGGTLSVNAHGIAHNPGQIGPTVRWMRVMLADGTIKKITPEENSELFSMVLGGYGLTAIILDVQLDIVPNKVYTWETDYIDYTEFSDFFTNNVTDNNNVQLMYARLSIAPGKNYLKEVAVHRYVTPDFKATAKPLGPASKVWIKRLIFNLSKTGSIGRWIRWNAEKNIEPGYHNCISRNQAMSGTDEEICVASRNQKMNQSMEYLSTRIKDTNILNEYFIPQKNTTAFIDGLRNVVKETGVNLLNVTLRVVTKDTLSALPYAREDSIAYVLYFNQKLTIEDSQKMEKATIKLINLANSLEGTYYLPYQLYYSNEQLSSAYPSIDSFFETKRKYDPDELFSNTFYRKYGK